MNISLSTAKKAFRLFSHKHVDKALVRANVLKWLAAMEKLGDNHILAKKIERKS